MNRLGSLCRSMISRLKAVFPFLVVFALAYIPFLWTQKQEHSFFVDQASWSEGSVQQETKNTTLIVSEESSGGLVIFVRYHPSLRDYIVAFLLISFLIYIGALSNWRRPRGSKELEAELAYVESHPRYREFIDADAEHCHIYKEEVTSKFYKWLGENDTR